MKRPIVITLLAAALLLVLAGIGAVLFFTFNAGSFDFSNVTPGFSARAEETKSLKVDGPVSLKVSDDAGDVTITGADIEAVTIDIVKQGFGRSQILADEALKNIDYTIEQDGNSITLEFAYPRLEGQIEQQVDFTITVPFETTVEVDASFGKLKVMDIQGDVQFVNKFGNMTAEKIDGALELKTESGLIDIVAVNAGTRDIKINSGFGSVNIEQASGANITIESKSGALDLRNVRATREMTLLTSFGSINFESASAGSLDAQTNSGRVTLTSVTVNGSLTARSDFGEIILEKVSANSYDVETSSGTISLDGAQDEVRAHTGFGNIKINNAENAMLDLNTQSGTIEFSGSLGAGPHTVHSDFGGIELTIPSDSALNVTLITKFGSITSDIPITVTLTGNIKEDTQAGSMNGGGAEMKVETDSGNITIKALK